MRGAMIGCGSHGHPLWVFDLGPVFNGLGGSSGSVHRGMLSYVQVSGTIATWNLGEKEDRDNEYS